MHKAFAIFFLVTISADYGLCKVLDADYQPNHNVGQLSCGPLPIATKVEEDGCLGVYSALSCIGTCSSYEIPLFNTVKLYVEFQYASTYRLFYYF